MQPKQLTQLVRNAQSAIGDPGVSIELLKNRLKGLVEVLEQEGEKIFALPDYAEAVVNLMLEVHKMKTLKVDKQEEEEGKVVSLQLITGGKEPPISSPGDWLSPLADGTVFYVQAKQNPMDFNLGLFRKMKTEGKIIHLLAPPPVGERPVNPVRFCNSYTLYQEVCILEQEEKTDDGNRDEPTDGAETPKVDGPEGG